MAKSKEKSKPKTRTKAFKETYNGKPIFAIWPVDGDGKKIEDSRPVASFGITKARAILKHVDKLEKFVDLVTQEEGAGDDDE